MSAAHKLILACIFPFVLVSVVEARVATHTETYTVSGSYSVKSNYSDITCASLYDDITLQLKDDGFVDVSKNPKKYFSQIEFNVESDKLNKLIIAVGGVTYSFPDKDGATNASVSTPIVLYLFDSIADHQKRFGVYYSENCSGFVVKSDHHHAHSGRKK